MGRPGYTIDARQWAYMEYLKAAEHDKETAILNAEYQIDQALERERASYPERFTPSPDICGVEVLCNRVEVPLGTVCVLEPGHKEPHASGKHRFSSLSAVPGDQFPPDVAMTEARFKRLGDEVVKKIPHELGHERDPRLVLLNEMRNAASKRGD